MRVKVTLRCNECKQRNYKPISTRTNTPTKVDLTRNRGKWFREMRSELKKVVWPTGKDTAKNTGTVLLCSLCVGACIWIFDAVAMLAVKSLLGVFAG